MLRKCRECGLPKPLTEYGRRLDRCLPCLEEIQGRSEKRCSRCRLLQPIGEYYANSRMIDGRMAACKGCFQKINALSGLKSQLRWKARLPSTLPCRVCRREKPLMGFHRRRGTRYGRATLCKACDRAASERRRRTYPGRRKSRRDTAMAAVRRVWKMPEALVFPLDEEMRVLAENLEGASVSTVASTLRMMAMRGIWEGYQRALRSFCAHGAPADAEELTKPKRGPKPIAEGEHFLAHQAYSGELHEGEGSVLAMEGMRLEVPVESEPEPLVASLAAVEALAIRAALEATRGNKAEAARKLGIDRGSLYAKLRRIQETEEDPHFDPLEAEADAVLRAG